MIETLILGIFTIGLIIFYTITSVALALLTQLVVYQLTGFSIYNWAYKKIMVEVKR